MLRQEAEEADGARAIRFLVSETPVTLQQLRLGNYRPVHFLRIQVGSGGNEALVQDTCLRHVTSFQVRPRLSVRGFQSLDRRRCYGGSLPVQSSRFARLFKLMFVPLRRL